MRWSLQQLGNGDERLYITPRAADMNRNVQSRFSWSRACLLADELIHQRRTALARPGTLRRPARSSIILELVEPVPQVRRVLVEVDRDLAERVDPSCTLCLPIMILAVALLAAEIERHS